MYVEVREDRQKTQDLHKADIFPFHEFLFTSLDPGNAGSGCLIKRES